LSSPDREAVETVGNYLDYLGLLVSQNLLAIDAPAMFLGGSAKNMWRKLRPIIDAERGKSPARASYQAYFEDIVARCEEYPIDAKVAALKKMPRT
jgi:hypothetical protein